MTDQLLNDARRALRDFQDAADDLLRARYGTFDNSLKRLVAALEPGTVLGDVASSLPDPDFQTWYKTQLASVGGMVGSGELDWPIDRGERLAMQLSMLRHLSGGDLSFHELVSGFIYVRNSLDDNIAEFNQQIVRPFVRDMLRYAHDTPEFVAQLHSYRSPNNGSGTPSGPAQSVLNRVVLFVETEAERRGRLWAVVAVLLSLLLAALALL